MEWQEGTGRVALVCAQSTVLINKYEEHGDPHGKDRGFLRNESVYSLDGYLVCLSASWCTKETRLLVSRSDGCLNLFHDTPTGLILDQQWSAHEYEAWTACFSAPNICYSGGDDCRFKGWNLRSLTPTFSSKLYVSSFNGCLRLKVTHKTHDPCHWFLRPVSWYLVCKQKYCVWNRLE